jgi:hypothetical protein
MKLHQHQVWEDLKRDLMKEDLIVQGIPAMAALQQ